MKMEMFTGTQLNGIKADINEWLEAHPGIVVYFIEQSMALMPGLRNILITIWYTEI